MGGNLRVRVRRVPAVPVAAVRIWLAAGERSAQRPGEALLAGRMLEEGSGPRDWRRVAADAEDRGISIAAFGSYEVMGVAVDGPAHESDRMIDWAAELVSAPTFDDDRWQWQRRLAMAELALIADEPDTLASWSFLRQLYGTHPRGRPLQGEVDTLRDLRRDDSIRAHARGVAAGVIATMAGDVDETRATERLQTALASDQESPERPPEPVAPEGVEQRRTVGLPGEQAHLCLGRKTVTRDHPDLPALEVLAVVLGAGAGLAGRLPERVREREGLAYTTAVDTAAGASADPGRLVVYAATAPEKVGRTELAVREELDRLLQEGVTDSELEIACSYLGGQELFRRETARQWADLMAEAEHTGLPVDSDAWVATRWSGVDTAELLRVARDWLDPADLQATIGLPKDLARFDAVS